MSEQQVERLQALLETVQKNRQRPGQPLGPGSAVGVMTHASPANTTDVVAGAVRGRAAPAPEPPAVPAAAAPSPAAPPAPAPRRDAPIQAAQRAPEPQLASPGGVAQPITPKVTEPDPPKEPTRPIAQLVSKHAPVVDATFGAMLKRSLSLRPQ